MTRISKEPGFFHFAAKHVRADPSRKSHRDVIGYMRQDRERNLRTRSKVTEVRSYLLRQEELETARRDVLHHLYRDGGSGLSSNALWLANDRANRRADGHYKQHAGRSPRLGSFITASFPYDVTLPDAIDAIEQFADHLCATYRVACEAVIHAKNGAPDHGHILMTDRIVGSDGVGAKIRALNGIHAKTMGLVVRDGDVVLAGPMEAMRATWAEMIRHIAPTEAVIDHRSFRRRGLDLEPVSYVTRGIIRTQEAMGETRWKQDRAIELERRRLPIVDPPIEVEATSVSPGHARTIRTDPSPRSDAELFPRGVHISALADPALTMTDAMDNVPSLLEPGALTPVGNGEIDLHVGGDFELVPRLTASANSKETKSTPGRENTLAYKTRYASLADARPKRSKRSSFERHTSMALVAFAARLQLDEARLEGQLSSVTRAPDVATHPNGVATHQAAFGDRLKTEPTSAVSRAWNRSSPTIKQSRRVLAAAAMVIAGNKVARPAIAFVARMLDELKRTAVEAPRTASLSSRLMTLGRKREQSVARDDRQAHNASQRGVPQTAVPNVIGDVATPSASALPIVPVALTERVAGYRPQTRVPIEPSPERTPSQAQHSGKAVASDGAAVSSNTSVPGEVVVPDSPTYVLLEEGEVEPVRRRTLFYMQTPAQVDDVSRSTKPEKGVAEGRVLSSPEIGPSLSFAPLLGRFDKSISRDATHAGDKTTLDEIPSSSDGKADRPAEPGGRATDNLPRSAIPRSQGPSQKSGGQESPNRARPIEPRLLEEGPEAGLIGRPSGVPVRVTSPAFLRARGKAIPEQTVPGAARKTPSQNIGDRIRENTGPLAFRILSEGSPHEILPRRKAGGDSVVSTGANDPSRAPPKQIQDELTIQSEERERGVSPTLGDQRGQDKTTSSPVQTIKENPRLFDTRIYGIEDTSLNDAKRPTGEQKTIRPGVKTAVVQDKNTIPVSASRPKIHPSGTIAASSKLLEKDDPHIARLTDGAVLAYMSAIRKDRQMSRAILAMVTSRHPQIDIQKIDAMYVATFAAPIDSATGTQTPNSSAAAKSAARHQATSLQATGVLTMFDQIDAMVRKARQSQKAERKPLPSSKGKGGRDPFD